MDTHYFKSLPGKYKIAYRNYYTLQNLLSIRNCALIFLLINISLRVLVWIIPGSITRAQNFPEFNLTNWIYIMVTPIFYLASYLFINHIRKVKKANAAMIAFVFLFSFYLILCGMYSSFIATSDPRNALTIYMVALSIIGVMCVLEWDETIILLVLAEIVFTALLLYSNADATEMLYNQLISVILLAGFYLISRYFYSYKASYYNQIIEIREQNIEIEKAGAFKNQVLGMVAHDLRNPIAAVESLAMMMELEDDITEDTLDSVSMIKQSCVKARGIIDDLLDAARNENINELTTVKTELNGLLQHNIDVWNMQQNGNNPISLISNIQPVYAQINAEKFNRVIDNLISNAVKFSKDNNGVELYLSSQDNFVTIKVDDHGLGIPIDMISHIFEPFSKAGRTGLKGEQSTGLGLSIVKQLIESHKGSITVQSEEGKGTTFIIKLPVSN